VSRSRTERLVNLVICLLSTRRFLTAAQIAATVPGYEHHAEDPQDHEAFQRKFERDKAALRDLGVPLETGTTSVFDTEPGYRIARRAYALPEIPLEPDEAAMAGLAVRLWQHAGLADAAVSGLAKLQAAGIEVDREASLGVEPVVTIDPAFASITAAVRVRRVILFRYQVPESDVARPRRLEPWGVACWRGRWYVVGHDLDRQAPRCFRLSRVVDGVRATGPAGAYELPEVDLLAHVARWSGPPERTGRATVRVRPGRGAGLRRWAEPVGVGPEADILTLRYADLEWLAGWLAGYGADVLVLDPPELRDLVVARLREIAASYGAASPALAAVPG